MRELISSRGSRADVRWEISEEERRAAHLAETGWTTRDLARTLIRSPRVTHEFVKLAARAAMTGIWNDVELGVLIDSERVRQALPGTVRGAAWSPYNSFLDALVPRVAPSMGVLEIGCGVGRLSRLIAPRVAALTCTDISALMIKEAEAALAEFPNVTCAKTSGYWLEGVPSATFHVVYAHAVFVFFDPYPAIASLDAARRVLLEGGTCVVGFHTIDRSDWAAEAVRTARRGAGRGAFGARVSRPYTKSQVAAMFEATGFDIVECIDDAVTPDNPHPPTTFVATATRQRPSLN